MRVTRRETLIAGAAAALAVGTGIPTRTSAAGIAGFDYRSYDAIGLAETVRRGDLSAEELLEEAIRRAEIQDSRLNFFAQEMFDYGRSRIAA